MPKRRLPDVQNVFAVRRVEAQPRGPRAIADWVIVMQNCRIVGQGEKDRVFAPPHEPYTERLLGSVPDMAVGWRDRIIAVRVA